MTTELYKKVYQIGLKLPKSNRLGIFAKIEANILEALENAIEASFLPRSQKAPKLLLLRRKLEILKRLVRIVGDLEIIQQKTYIELSFELQTISKMANGWIKSLP
ncbi:MAG: four helix bundle protein [Patescibacteria group bacterium]